MKKFVPLILALAMVLSLAACGGSEAPSGTSSGNPQQSTESNAVSSTGTRANRIIYATTAQTNGDFDCWYTNAGIDAMVHDLINDYSVVVQDRDGVFIRNDAVCESIESTEYEDGSIMYTVKIREGLTYNNGEPITAADYCAYALVAYSAAVYEAGSFMSGYYIEGGDDYQFGDSICISGLHMPDEYTYTILIAADYAGYYHSLSYAALEPLYLPTYSTGLTVKDDGDGVYLDGGELDSGEVYNGTFTYEGRVSAGPYSLSSVDIGSYSVTVELNPYYVGNFEGQKPSIQTLVIAYTPADTRFDSLTTGGVDLISGLAGGDAINQALDMAEQGGYSTCDYPSLSYNMIQFVCDGGPTQFLEVRQAIAYLFDRSDFVNSYTQGYGTVINAPYSPGQWQYEESEELFAAELNPYAYNPSKAVELLEEGGWNLNADGTPYSGSGLRYKEVTAEEAGSYDLNVTLADGRILMPLRIRWASVEGSGQDDLFATMMVNGTQVAGAGMQIDQDVMTSAELNNWMYRASYLDPKYGAYYYGMWTMAFTIYPNEDRSYWYSTDEDYIALGWNVFYIRDQELDDYTMNMVYAVEPGDEASFLDYWQKFMIRSNEVLPDLPTFSAYVYTIFPDWLQGYEETSTWEFAQAILYATIDGAE